jgi:hypothetical protein
MNSRRTSPPARPHVTIRVSGKLFDGHLPYLEQLVQSATECKLWPLLSLSQLDELDRTALLYLINGENREFGIISCPRFVKDWMEHERAAA